MQEVGFPLGQGIISQESANAWGVFSSIFWLDIKSSSTLLLKEPQSPVEGTEQILTFPHLLSF